MWKFWDKNKAQPSTSNNVATSEEDSIDASSIDIPSAELSDDAVPLPETQEFTPETARALIKKPLISDEFSMIIAKLSLFFFLVLFLDAISDDRVPPDLFLGMYLLFAVVSSSHGIISSVIISATTVVFSQMLYFSGAIDSFCLNFSGSSLMIFISVISGYMHHSHSSYRKKLEVATLQLADKVENLEKNTEMKSELAQMDVITMDDLMNLEDV